MVDKIKVGDMLTLGDEERSYSRPQDVSDTHGYLPNLHPPVDEEDVDPIVYEVTSITENEEGLWYQLCDTDGCGYEGWIRGMPDHVTFKTESVAAA